MKKLILLSSLLLAVVSPTFSVAAGSEDFAIDFNLLLPTNPVVTKGMSRESLVAQLGQPSQQISPTLWLYTDFHAAGRPATSRDDTLVVVFVGDRVANLRLAEQAKVTMALAKVQANSVKAAAIAAK